jgi:hypothetical protein
MMPQEAREPGYEQTDSTYGHYQQFETPYQQPQQEGSAGKLYTATPGNINLYRLLVMAMAMATLIILALICLVLVGGLGGWISFCAACLSIFIIAASVVEKLK